VGNDALASTEASRLCLCAKELPLSASSSRIAADLRGKRLALFAFPLGEDRGDWLK
jgi:hypothetical protein